MFRRIYLWLLATLLVPALTGCGSGADTSNLPTPTTIGTTGTATTSTPLSPTAAGATGVTPTALALASPGPAGTATPAAGGATATSASPGGVGITPTVAAGGSATPGAAGSATPGQGGTSVTITVTTFSVWQNFMPGPGAGSPPLYASVEFDATNTNGLAAQKIAATHLIVRRGDGTTVLDAPVQGGMVDSGSGSQAPGMTQHYSYRSAPDTVSPTMTENEAVTGSLAVTVDGQPRQIPLPPTRVLFVQ